MSNFLSKLFGGGTNDGGAAEMRQQELERQARVRDAINRINEIFGGEITPPPAPAPANIGGGGRGTALINKTLSTVQPPPEAPAPTVAPGQFGDDYFKSIADAYLNFQRPLLDEQAAEARRTLPMGFASTGSSAFIRKQAELERDIARENAQLGDQANDFANKQRAQVEQNRGDLVNLAQSGIDASTIASMAGARASALAKPPVFTPIADAFQKYTALAANASSRLPVNQNPFFFRRAGSTFDTGDNGAVRMVEA